MQVFKRKAKPQILILGAAGRIGKVLHQHLCKKGYPLRLVDKLPVSKIKPEDETLQFDIANVEHLANAMREIDIVIDLTWCGEALNIKPYFMDGIQNLYNVFEEAKKAGVKRVIYASSIHTMGFYPQNKKIGINDPVRPDGFYGLTKVFGESIGRLYSDKFGLSVICLRICAFSPKPVDRRMLSYWVSHKDAMHLFTKAIETPNVKFTIAYGVSNNKTAMVCNKGTEIKGFKPSDNAEPFRPELQHQVFDDPVANSLVGSLFVATKES